MGVDLLLRSKACELAEKKAIITTSVYADGVECVAGEVVAVRVASRMLDAEDSSRQGKLSSR